MENTIEKRLWQLREYMRSHGLSAFVVGSSDPHGSEYVADRWKAREWISGFDGSAGTAVITQDSAMLWTDSRYWLAAETVFANSEYELMKERVKDVPTVAEWLCSVLECGDVVGVDGTVCSLREVYELRDTLAKKEISLDTSHDPFDEIWENRPSVPMSVAEIIPESIAGESVQSKLARIRERMEQIGLSNMLFPMLDEVAWVTNLRGADVDYNPVLVAYLLVSKEQAILFIDNAKLTDEVRTYLHKENITIEAYDAIWHVLNNYPYDTICLPDGCNAAIVERLNKATTPLFRPSVVADMKSIKNSIEIEGFKKAMLAEGIAMVKLLHWLKPAVEKGGVTELDVDYALTAFRKEDKNFRGLSFATIAAYGKNGAIVHYEPTPSANAELQPKSFLLLDCGGQYQCGTTDITRTIPLGSLTQEEREDYTRVLRGHISLAMAKFPVNTFGVQLDVLARQWLWQAGENYLHGTGHGVGHFLNVHEGPHQIRMNFIPATLKPGMTVTNEPGIYKADRFGIRIENTMLVCNDITTEFGAFCSLQPLTICPIDKEPIIPELLGCEAIEYLNNYHAWVYEQLASHFDGELLEFLKDACAPLK